MRLALVVVCLVFAAESPSAAPDPTLELVGKLAEKPSGLLACGRVATRAVVRFEVEKVIAGDYKASDVYAIFTCPEGLKIGDRIRMKLGPALPADQYIDKLKKGAPRFTILEVRRP